MTNDPKGALREGWKVFLPDFRSPIQKSGRRVWDGRGKGTVGWAMESALHALVP